jgi:hypothetical protein
MDIFLTKKTRGGCEKTLKLSVTGVVINKKIRMTIGFKTEM